MKRKNRKTWHKLSKTEKVFQVGSNNFYINWNQKKKFFNKENLKITKQVHAFNCYASSNNLEVLNFFNPELQLKDTEYAIKNKLKRFSLN